MKYTYCVDCLLHFTRMSTAFTVTTPLSKGALAIVNKTAEGKYEEINTGTMRYTGVPVSGLTLPSVQAIIEWIEMFGHEWLYTDEMSCTVWPIAVAVVNNHSVCLQHVMQRR